MKKLQPIMKGYEKGISPPPINGKAPALTTEYAHRTNTYGLIHVLEYEESTKAGFVEIHPGECFDAENPNSETRRGRKMTEKSNCLMAKENTDFMRYEGPRIITLNGRKVRVLGIRRLTPTECSRLQTIPTWYRWECSNSQAYRMLGNGWTVEVIKHFFSFLPWAKKEA